MSDVISPAPQRVMPEVPESIQDNIAQLDDQASQNSAMAGQYPVRSVSYGNPSPHSSFGPGSAYGYDDRASFMGGPYSYGYDGASLSPFPVLHNPPPNVPPTDEQREANLENGRVAVLNSNDPEMQVAWAQDALSYVEVALQNEMRQALVDPPRPSTPAIEYQLRKDAINVVSFLAEQHHPRAEFIRGMWLEFGKFGFRMDKAEAFRCYARAAERGYARAEYRIGMQFENSNELAKAIKHYERGVAAGDSASHYRLGMMILLGQHGQKQDFVNGLEHIRYAAETCDENAPQGAYVYGMLLAKELPQVAVPEDLLPFDVDAARMNIEKAAYHGFAKAQVKMGAAYELCQLGCDFDPQMSLHYNVLAARQGEPEAEMAISKWFLCGHEGLFEKNDEIAFKYAKRAASSGLPTAEFAMGYFYEIGIFVPVDIKEARSWYAKASASGNKDATGRIDSISRSKTLSRKDHETVAIARIKSRYGTQRGGKYGGRGRGRGEQPAGAQPAVEIPDPSRLSLNDTPGSATAPYPEDPYTPPVGGYGPPAPRSSSAFGINPHMPPPQPLRQPGKPGGGPPGPYMRSVSQPGYPGSPTSPHGPPSAHGAPPINIGYSAPPDPRRPKPPHAASSPGPAGRPQMRASSAGNFSVPGGAPAKGPAHPQSPKPSATPPSSSPAPTESSEGQKYKPNLPGKGPKTFEEMGVPPTSKDSDCVVM